MSYPNRKAGWSNSRNVFACIYFWGKSGSYKADIKNESGLKVEIRIVKFQKTDALFSAEFVVFLAGFALASLKHDLMLLLSV